MQYKIWKKKTNVIQACIQGINNWDWVFLDEWFTLVVVWFCLHSDVRRGFDSFSHRDVLLLQRSNSSLHLDQHERKLSTVYHMDSQRSQVFFSLKDLAFLKRSRYLLLQPIQRLFLTVSMELQLSHRWTQETAFSKTFKVFNIELQLTSSGLKAWILNWLKKKFMLPFSSATWRRVARERVQLSSLVQAGKSSSITTWSTGWNFPWAQQNIQARPCLRSIYKKPQTFWYGTIPSNVKVVKQIKTSKSGSQIRHFLRSGRQ